MELLKLHLRVFTEASKRFSVKCSRSSSKVTARSEVCCTSSCVLILSLVAWFCVLGRRRGVGECVSQSCSCGCCPLPATSSLEKKSWEQKKSSKDRFPFRCGCRGVFADNLGNSSSKCLPITCFDFPKEALSAVDGLRCEGVRFELRCCEHPCANPASISRVSFFCAMLFLALLLVVGVVCLSLLRVVLPSLPRALFSLGTCRPRLLLPWLLLWWWLWWLRLLPRKCF